MKVKSESEVAQSCPTLSDPMDCSLPGSSVHGIFQARVLEWGAIAFSVSSAKMGRNLRVVNYLLCARLKAKCFVDIVSLNFKFVSKVKGTQSCLTLCDPIDGSPPGSLVPGILQARTLEWVAIAFSSARLTQNIAYVTVLCTQSLLNTELPSLQYYSFAVSAHSAL